MKLQSQKSCSPRDPLAMAIVANVSSPFSLLCLFSQKYRQGEGFDKPALKPLKTTAVWNDPRQWTHALFDRYNGEAILFSKGLMAQCGSLVLGGPFLFSKRGPSVLCHCVGVNQRSQFRTFFSRSSFYEREVYFGGGAFGSLIFWVLHLIFYFFCILNSYL